MGDVNSDLQDVVDQCNSFANQMSPSLEEIEDLRSTIDDACDFSLSGSIVPAALAKDLIGVEKAYRIVSDVLASVEEAKIIRRGMAKKVMSAAIRASGQSSRDKREADADHIAGKFDMAATRFEGFYKYCEKKLDSVQMRYYTVRAALTSIEQDLRISSTPGMGTRQLVDSASMPNQSALANDQNKGGEVNWSDI